MVSAFLRHKHHATPQERLSYETGITGSQVAHFMINYRSRNWGQAKVIRADVGGRPHKPAPAKLPPAATDILTGKSNVASPHSSSHSWFTEWMVKHSTSPFPSSSDKKKLCKKSGLTSVQVRNWFTNIRKRHWAPLRRNEKEASSLLDHCLVVMHNNEYSPGTTGGTGFMGDLQRSLAQKSLAEASGQVVKIEGFEYDPVKMEGSIKRQLDRFPRPPSSPGPPLAHRLPSRAAKGKALKELGKISDMELGGQPRPPPHYNQEEMPPLPQVNL